MVVRAGDSTVRQAVFCEDDSLGDRVGHGGVLLGLRCNARDSRLYLEGLKRGGFGLSGDDADRYVLPAFQVVQSGWGQPGLPG